MRKYGSHSSVEDSQESGCPSVKSLHINVEFIKCHSVVALNCPSRSKCNRIVSPDGHITPYCKRIIPDNIRLVASSKGIVPNEPIVQPLNITIIATYSIGLSSGTIIASIGRIVLPAYFGILFIVLILYLLYCQENIFYSKTHLIESYTIRLILIESAVKVKYLVEELLFQELALGCLQGLDTLDNVRYLLLEIGLAVCYRKQL